MNPAESSSCSAVKYRGVRKRSWGKWVSEIRLPNCRERIWLGSYDSPRKAARAFDAALYCLRGRKANFNFPASVPDIPRASALTPPEIQAAAAHFAHNIPPADVGTRPTSAAGNSPPARSSSELSEDLVGSLEVSLGADGWWSELDLVFPAFDEFPTRLLPPELEPWGVDFVGENVDDKILTSQHSFLWDF